MGSSAINDALELMGVQVVCISAQYMLKLNVALALLKRLESASLF